MKPALARCLATVLGLLLGVSAFADEVIPPKPTRYFSDYAGVVSPAVAARLEAQLQQLERDAYNQVLVVIFPKMQSDSSIEDYTVRVANAWQVGQHDKRNGAVLFVFAQDHKMYLQVGYGLEGAVPDAIAKRIIADEIAPHFKAQDYDGGLMAGVTAIIAASKGEYRGTGRTVAERKAKHQARISGLLPVIIVIIVVLSLSRSRRRGGLLSTAGWILSSGGGNWSGGQGGGWSGGGSGGGGGGFSSGGGSFGGGGAGGSW